MTWRLLGFLLLLPTRLLSQDPGAATDASGLYLATPIALEPHSLFPRWSPDGQRLSYTVCPTDRAGRRLPCQVWLANKNGTGRAAVATGRYAIWSPTGTRLAFVRNDSLVVLDLRDRRQVAVNLYLPGWRGARWLPGERFILDGSSRLDLETLSYVDLQNLSGAGMSTHWVDSVVAFQRQWRALDPNVREAFCIADGPEAQHRQDIPQRCPGDPRVAHWYGLGGDVTGEGIWALNRDRTYATFLTAGGEHQLSPDGRQLAFEGSGIRGPLTPGQRDSSRVIVATLMRRTPARELYVTDLGRERGIVPGDLLSVRPSRSNPLTRTALGPVTDPDSTRAVLIVLGADSGRALLQTFRYSYPVRRDDVAFASDKLWATVRRVDSAGWQRQPPDPLRGVLVSWQTERAFDLIADYHANPDVVQILLNLRSLEGLQALGRLRRRDAVDALLAKLPRAYNALESDGRTIIFALGEIGERSALSSVAEYCRALPAPNSMGVMEPDAILRVKAICERALARMRE